MSRFRFLLLAASGAASLTLAFPASAEPMAQAVASALNHHPSVEAALANRNALAEESREKWSDYWPQLSVGATGGRMYADNSTSRGLTVDRGAGYSWLWEGNVTARQLIFDGFETFNRIDAAGARQRSASFNVFDVRERLALRTVVAYLDILRGRDSVARLKEHGKKIDTYIGRIEKMVDEGAADATMAEQARDIRAQLDNTLASSEGQLRAANAAYLELTGHPPDEAMDMPAPPAGAIPADIQEAVDHARKEHPALRAAMMTEAAFQHDAEAEKAALYPDFTGELSYLERDQDDVIGGEVKDGRAVVRLN